jgi:RNA polymerase sigma-70 factor, ECF subfamily
MASASIDLIRRMAGRDRDALAAFYDTYSPLAFGVLRRMLPPEEAAEVLQDVFWALWRGASDYDPARGTPEAWVTVRARSRGIDRLRSLRRRDEMFVSAEPRGDVTDDPSAEFASLVEERDLLRGALGALPPEQREVIGLAYFGGLSQSEIASRLGQPLGTVKTRIRLGMDRLRGLVGARA